MYGHPPTSTEAVELLAALLIRVHAHEADGMPYRSAVLIATAELNADPAAVVGRLREASREP